MYRYYQAIVVINLDLVFLWADVNGHTKFWRSSFCCKSLECGQQSRYQQNITVVLIESALDTARKILSFLYHCLVQLTVWISDLCSLQACHIARRISFFRAFLNEINQILETLDLLQVGIQGCQIVIDGHLHVRIQHDLFFFSRQSLIPTPA